jgi:acetylglutamate kinase
MKSDHISKPQSEQTFQERSEKPYLVIKIGGRPAASLDRLRELFVDIKDLQEDYSPVLVHGGGAEVSQISRTFGLEPTFVNGIRMTTEPEMDVVDMVLAGLMNTRLLRQASISGVQAVGLSGVDGGLWTCESIDSPGLQTKHPDNWTKAQIAQPEYKNRTGRVITTNPQVLRYLCAGGYVPVLSSVAQDAQGFGLNINADDGALAVAEGLKAFGLMYISDIPGVLKHEQPISYLTPAIIQQEISNQVITGGMIPKVQASVTALDQGVGRVVIGDYTQRGDLLKLVRAEKGTTIGLEPAVPQNS